MTKKQERIAEFIIQAHKDNNGVYEWDDYITQHSSNDEERLVIARELKDRDFIDNFINGKTRLKKAGCDFNGFDIERENSIEQKTTSEQAAPLAHDNYRDCVIETER